MVKGGISTVRFGQLVRNCDILYVHMADFDKFLMEFK